MLIDFHNHHLSPTPGVLSIRSFHQREQSLFAEWIGPCSVGLHPWFVAVGDLAQEEQWDWLRRVAAEEKALLLGECGLDKLQGPEMVYQQVAFEQCLQLAGQLQKPVVIHCVRAYQELFASVQKIKPGVPLIIHGYARKSTALKPILEQGFYVSFGAAILASNGAAAQSLVQTPLEKLFLESDDKMLPIIDLYARAAQIKGVTIPVLETALQNNWEKIRALQK